LKIKNSINQIKDTLKIISNRPGQAEERISGIDDKVEEILHLDRISRMLECD
jgi:hypothetical protein